MIGVVARVEPDTVTEDELRAHLRLWPITWIPCIACRSMFEFQVDNIGGRCSFFCSDECYAKHRGPRPVYEVPGG